VVGGSLTISIDGDAFADQAAYNGGGGPLTPGQPFLEFAKHFSPAETVGVSVTGDGSSSGFRPAPSPTNFKDLRATWLRPSSDNLAFGINGTGPIGPQPTGRGLQPTTFEFDPADVAGTATGRIGTVGTASFWYANDEVIDNMGSIWLAFGDMSLRYNPARQSDGDSGWYFTNHLMFDQVAFDTRNISIDAGTPGQLTITGDLVMAQEMGGMFAMTNGFPVGSFVLNALTPVPEPSTFALGMMAGVGLLAGYFRRRGSSNL